jgi:hypothetical protein
LWLVEWKKKRRHSAVKAVAAIRHRASCGRGSNLVFSESKAINPRMKNMRSIPECSKSFIWEGFKTPLTKNLR